jgi:hypothetical protein
MSRDIGGGHCWIRTVGTDACGYYLHTESTCPNILSGPGAALRYKLSEWEGRKPQCPVCARIVTNRLVGLAHEKAPNPFDLLKN